MRLLVNSTSKQNENQKNFQNRVESLGNHHRDKHGPFHGSDRLLAGFEHIHKYRGRNMDLSAGLQFLLALFLFFQ